MSVVAVGDQLDTGPTLVVGAPEMRGTDELREHTGEIVRTPSDLPADSASTVGIDGLYGFVTQYEQLPPADQTTVREQLRDIRDHSTVHASTTPYRLEWLLSNRRSATEAVVGSIARFDAVFVRVSDADVDERLRREASDGTIPETVRERLDELTYSFDVANRFDGVVSDETYTDLFGSVKQYETHVFSATIAAASADDPARFIDSRTELVNDLGRTLAGSGLYEGTKEIVEQLADSETSITESLSAIRRDGLDAVNDLSATEVAASIAPFVEPATLGATALVAWAYSRHRGQPDTRQQIRAEFETLLGGRNGIQTPADRELVEIGLELEPMTLSALDSLTGSEWPAVRRSLDRLDELASDVSDVETRLDELDRLVADNETRLENLRLRLERVETSRATPNVYKSIEEFEQGLFSPQEYVEVGAVYETDDYTGTTREQVDDARARLVALLREGVRTVRVQGEGGIGKSQLMLSAGRALTDEYDVLFTDSSSEQLPNLTGDTVLFVDDAGRKEMDEFVRLADPTNRPADTRDHDLQVVVAARSVYEDTVKSVTDEVGGRGPKLEIQPLAEQQAKRILNRFDIENERASEFHDVAEGNPFFTVMLGEAAGAGEEDPPEIKKSFERVVRQMVNTDLAQVGESVEDVRNLLNVVAALGGYEEPEDVDAVTAFAPVFEAAGKRRNRLRQLGVEGYLDVPDDGVDRGPCSIQYDPVADYLVFQLLRSDETRFREYVRAAFERNSVPVAGVLVGLAASPLERFYDAREALVENLEWVAERAFEASIPLDQLYATQLSVSLPLPGAVNHDELLARLADNENPDEIIGAVVVFVGRYVQLVEDDSELIELTERYLGQIQQLSFTDEDAVVSVASLLVDVVSSYGEVDALDQMETRLGDLSALYEAHTVETVRTELAKGLLNATKPYGEAEAWNELEETLTCLEELQTSYAEDAAVRTELAKGLVNATNAYGEAEAWNELEETLTRLEELQTSYPEDAAVRTELAKGLYNAAVDYTLADRFTPIAAQIDRIGTITTTHGNLGGLLADDPERFQKLTRGLLVTRHELAIQLLDALRPAMSDRAWTTFTAEIFRIADRRFAEDDLSFEAYNRLGEYLD